GSGGVTVESCYLAYNIVIFGLFSGTSGDNFLEHGLSEGHQHFHMRGALRCHDIKVTTR
ncbi:hypothetical protein TNCV_619771, partial [Trichonephila clavipes]